MRDMTAALKSGTIARVAALPLVNSTWPYIEVRRTLNHLVLFSAVSWKTLMGLESWP
jgi:hypothetical protein